MANPWFRLWTDMVNDPKWRTISRVSKQEISRVIAVALHMMTCASNATERGHIEGWSDEDIATALDIDIEDIEAIRGAMQGRFLNGNYLTGWEKRQPKREREDDTAADRKRAQREREREGKNVTPQEQQENAVTPCHTMSHHVTPREEEIREEEKKSKSKAETQRATRLPADWQPSDADFEFCKAERPDLHVGETAARFRDYWHGIGGQKGCKLDWSATWRNWVRNERASPQARASPTQSHPTLGKAGQATAANLQRWLEESDAGH